MADGRHIAKCWKRYNSPTNMAIWMKLGWSHVPHDAVAMATVPSNCELYIQDHNDSHVIKYYNF